MLAPGLINDIKVNIFNTSKVTVGMDWNYSNIVSPFSRIYLITEGEGFVLPNNQMYRLKPGYLYFIPSYTHCGYHCVESLTQYYLHFTHQLSSGIKIFDNITIQHEVKASLLDYSLFNRLLELNPSLALKYSDPNIYEQRNWYSNNMSHLSNGVQLETIGILKQLFSRFIVDIPGEPSSSKAKSKMYKVFVHISENLYQDIKVEDLAQIACCSKDHFSRQFKKLTGMLPTDFINNKRIDKAKEILITTSKSQRQISEEIGFNSQQYYTRIFKKITGETPAEYRKMGGLI
ncbi:AraC family transcriptional regulator [Saccharicrinis aurantiacus]|uniref:AraC family transcriptional regulator n=1 Tax=Saccharicrinis aurantiacus TaxID=1849719 RepID=UPI002490CB6E|nr:AraC family transcriptional regulator [Saccharicrinis aurantiacus]